MRKVSRPPRANETAAAQRNGMIHVRAASARGMASAAEAHREVLVKHGLSQSVLEEFVRMLDQFDEAVGLGIEGRTAHVRVTRELRAVATEIVCSRSPSPTERVLFRTPHSHHIIVNTWRGALGQQVESLSFLRLPRGGRSSGRSAGKIPSLRLITANATRSARECRISLGFGLVFPSIGELYPP